MLVLGLTKTTLLDYPGKVAATIFTGGCNFRCPYCHNSGLIELKDNCEVIDEDQIMSFLDKRKGIIEGVCISGGEPTLHPDLPNFVEEIRKKGYKIKLDTNGSNPQMLEKLIDEKLIDYVAMDIKNSKSKYAITTGGSKEDIIKVEKSLGILLSNKVDYELRTTVVRQFHDLDDLLDIAKWIEGCSTWYIQSYKDSENVYKQGLSAYSSEELKDMAGKISGINAQLRGVD